MLNEVLDRLAKIMAEGRQGSYAEHLSEAWMVADIANRELLRKAMWTCATSHFSKKDLEP
jgi:hypothetical protein